MPTPACTMPAFSTRNSTEPPLAPLTALVTSIVTVPTFGFGIMPRGPSTLPSRPTSGIMSGVAMQRSKSISPLLHLLDQVLGADHVGAGGLRFVGLGAAREHADAQRAAGAVRQVDDAAHHLVGVACGSTPRFIAISMVSSNFALARSLTSLTASASG